MVCGDAAMRRVNLNNSDLRSLVVSECMAAHQVNRSAVLFWGTSLRELPGAFLAR